jgi:hypothetical protein
VFGYYFGWLGPCTMRGWPPCLSHACCAPAFVLMSWVSNRAVHSLLSALQMDSSNAIWESCAAPPRVIGDATTSVGNANIGFCISQAVSESFSTAVATLAAATARATVGDSHPAHILSATDGELISFPTVVSPSPSNYERDPDFVERAGYTAADTIASWPSPTLRSLE